MNTVYAARRKNGSGTLLLTFLLGIAIGSSGAYALFDALHWDFAKKNAKPVETAAAKPEAAPPSPESAPPPPASPQEGFAPVPPPVPASYADVDGLWPARYVFVSVPGQQLDDATRAWLAEYKPGGVVLLPENIADEAQTKALVQQIKEAVGKGTGLTDLPLIAVAQNGAYDANPLKLPNALIPEELAKLAKGPLSKKDLEKIRNLAEDQAAAARARGIAVLLSPSADMPLLGIKEESKRERIVQSTTLWCRAWMEGVAKSGLSSVLNHFPGAEVVTERDGMLWNDLEGKRQAEVLYPFTENLAKTPCLLVSHIVLKPKNPSAQPTPSSLSPSILNEILRKTWNFGGVALADDVTAKPPMPDLTVEQSVVGVLAAGCDGVWLRQTSKEQLDAIGKAVAECAAKNEPLTRERLTEARGRLDAWRDAIAKLAAETAPSQPGPDGQIIHVVAPGETLKRIKDKYHVEYRQIIEWNHIKDPDALKPGDKLTIFLRAYPYTRALQDALKPGDKLTIFPAGEKAKPAEKPAEPAKPEAAKAPEPSAAGGPTESAAESKPVEPAKAADPVKKVEPAPEAAKAAPADKPAEPSTSTEAPKPAEPPKPAVTPPTPEAAKAPEPPKPAEPEKAATADKPTEQGAPSAPEAAKEAPKPAEAKTEAKPEETKKAEKKPNLVEGKDFEYYTVQEGDRFYKIARQFNTKVADILKLNNIENPDVVKAGQRIKVPKQ
jgi:LysM repeat protein/beta-glucosidase-like glycosyl hydrolase